MLCATFCLVQLLAPSTPPPVVSTEVGRAYDGAAAVPGPEAAQTEPVVAEQSAGATEPSEAVGAEGAGIARSAGTAKRSGAEGAGTSGPATPGQPVEPVGAPGPKPVGSEIPGAPRPKWWGPFPRPKVTGFGGPMLQLTGLKGAFAAMVGLGGGLTIKRRVSIGAAAMWLLNPAEAGQTSVGAPQRLNINFGGLLLAVVFARTKRVDFTVEGLIGGGGACLQNPNTGTCYARTAMFVGQPGLAAHIKLAPIVRLVFGLGYRFVAARAWTGPGNAQLGAPVGSATLEFGLF